MNPLGAPASRRPVGGRMPELAGETPALPGIVPRFIRVHLCPSVVKILFIRTLLKTFNCETA
jgi:hypothetical protein